MQVSHHVDLGPFQAKTCDRIRRIKCDETKPDCVKCSSTGRKCDGYIQGVLKKDDPTALMEPQRYKSPISKLSSCMLETVQEQRSLDYFFNRTAPALSGYFDADFWNRLVLQFSYSESAIRHAMMAVSSLHEQFESSVSRPPSASASNRFALQQYNKSITQLTGQLCSRQQTLELTLMLCILFTCIECLRSDSDAAMSHLQNGVNILCTWRAEENISSSQKALQPSSSPRFVEDVLVPIFARLNILTSLYGREAVTLYAVYQNNAIETQIIQPNSITSLSQARLVLGDIMSRILRFVQKYAIPKYTTFPDDATIDEQEQLLTRLHSWSVAFATWTGKSAVQWNPHDRQAADLLRIQYTTVLLMLSTSLSVEEAAFDRYIPEFEYIVKLSRPMAGNNPEGTTSVFRVSDFSFEIGGLPPLYYVAIKCRSPPIRRHALSLLSNMSRRESLWDARRLSKIAARVIEVEEMFLDERSGFPKEEGRIHAVGNVAPNGPGPHIIPLISFPNGLAGGSHITGECVIILG